MHSKLIGFVVCLIGVPIVFTVAYRVMQVIVVLPIRDKFMRHRRSRFVAMTLITAVSSTGSVLLVRWGCDQFLSPPGLAMLGVPASLVIIMFLLQVHHTMNHGSPWAFDAKDVILDPSASEQANMYLRDRVVLEKDWWALLGVIVGYAGAFVGMYLAGATWW